MSDRPGADRPYDGGLGSRREARERAIALLYEAETKGLDPAAVLGQLPVLPDAFTAALVEGVGAHLAEIDVLVQEMARDWRLERMPALDRAVLRLGTYELGWEPDTPLAVAISEAVELAKRYSTEQSGRFVNGVLSAISAKVRAGH